jgi:hypothetical protein
MTTRRRAPRKAKLDRPAPGLLHGFYVAWAVLVLLVILCVVIGLKWDFQPGTSALPTPVLALRNAPSQVASAGSVTPLNSGTALPTLTALVQAPVPPGLEQTRAAGQDASFGYGIQARLNIRTSATLDQLQELGLNWVKIPVVWAAIEPDPGHYQWAELDGVISASAARNLNILLTVSDAPNWARPVTAKGKNGPPDNVQNYVTIVTLILQRYGGVVRAIEIWSEENVDDAWYAPGGLNPASYLSLLVPTAQAIRQIDPGLMIISGALNPTGKNDNISAVDDFAYMQALIDGKVLDSVDCIGAHHIGFNLPPTLTAEDAFAGGLPPGTVFVGPYDANNPVNPHHSWSFTSTLNGYRTMVVAAGRDTPLCVTEFGWASAEDIGAPDPTFAFARDNTQDEQAKYIVRAFRVMHDWGFVRLAILYNLDYAAKPAEGDPSGAEFFSIVRPSGAPRPAYDALRDMPKLP